MINTRNKPLRLLSTNNYNVFPLDDEYCSCHELPPRRHSCQPEDEEFPNIVETTPPSLSPETDLPPILVPPPKYHYRPQGAVLTGLRAALLLAAVWSSTRLLPISFSMDIIFLHVACWAVVWACLCDLVLWCYASDGCDLCEEYLKGAGRWTFVLSAVRASIFSVSTLLATAWLVFVKVVYRRLIVHALNKNSKIFDFSRAILFDGDGLVGLVSSKSYMYRRGLLSRDDVAPTT